MWNRHTRPPIRRQVTLALDAALMAAATSRARRQGLWLQEYLERLVRRDLGRPKARDLVDQTAAQRSPVAAVWWRDLRRRFGHFQKVVRRTRRPLVVRGGATRPSREIRGRRKRDVVIRQQFVLLPVRRGARKRWRGRRA